LIFGFTVYAKVNKKGGYAKFLKGEMGFCGRTDRMGNVGKANSEGPFIFIILTSSHLWLDEVSS